MIHDKRRDLARQIRSSTVEQFHDTLATAGIHRAFISFENGEFTLSHPKILAPLQALFELSSDFARHEAVFIGREDGLSTLFFAFVHDTRRGLAQGGLRFWSYLNVAELLVDGLRLAQGMTRKNALAALWWGGGKGIIQLPPGYDHPDKVPAEEREKIFKAYGRFVASLKGIYYTAEDVGTKTPDMDAILSQCRFVTCISPALGGSGNPSPFTARGVFRAMQAAWLLLEGTERLEGVNVAVQGAGNVGTPLIQLLDSAGAQIWVSDVIPEKLQQVKAQFPRVHIVDSKKILSADVDILAPCARGGVVNAETIPGIKARLICGAANNILGEQEADSERLQSRGILFVPDYVCNRMGITNCADEWHGYLEEDVRLAAERVYPDTLRVLRHAKYLNITPLHAANELADIAASELHPLLGHRGRRILDSLISSGWHKESSKQTSRADLAFLPALDETPIRIGWQHEGLFRGTGLAIAAAPITAAARPSLASFLSALLMDVRARSLERITDIRPRRLLGSDHGGLALQLAVESSLPYSRQTVGRQEFVEVCGDYHERNDAAVREQLHALGIGFDPSRWLDPMDQHGKAVDRRLYFWLLDAGYVVRENRLAYRCPRCASVLVASEVNRSTLEVDRRYRVVFRTEAHKEIEVVVFSPELLLGGAAIAVSPDGRFAALAGDAAIDPLHDTRLPVFVDPSSSADAVLVVPSVDQSDAQLARQRGLTGWSLVFDEDGLVRLPEDPAAISPEEARDKIIARLGDRIWREPGPWSADIRRCSRCETVVLPDNSLQRFVHLEKAVGHLRQAIENGAVTFSHSVWKERVLAHLANLEPWCISRQYWWGNEIPDDPDDVFSTWFSLVGWALRGAGWPEDPSPSPLAEVLVDSEWLIRWVVPCELVALLVTGRPLFKHIVVHGPLHILDRKLERVNSGPLDEEAKISHVIHRPMRWNLGNAIEPITLIRRFGADSLRLGYLLALPTDPSSAVTLTESHLRRARHTVHSLVSKITGILTMIADPWYCGSARLLDVWIVARCRSLATAAEAAYRAGNLAQAGRLLVQAVEEIIAYVNAVAGRRNAGYDVGDIATAIVLALDTLKTAFGPICPFVFEKLGPWVRDRLSLMEPRWSLEPWADPLGQVAAKQTGVPIEITLPESLADLGHPESLEEAVRTTGTQITVLTKPAENDSLLGGLAGRGEGGRVGERGIVTP